MKKTILPLTLVIIIFSLIVSCVPYRKYQELQKLKDQVDQENKLMKNEMQNSVSQSDELKSKSELLQKKINGLQNDTMIMGTSLRKMSVNYDQLYRTYDQLLQKNNMLVSGNIAETEKLTNKLTQSQEELLRKEDALKKLEVDLGKQKDELEKAKQELINTQKRLVELERILARKDSVVKVLKQKVSEALLGFENNGLTVNIKNGKVYVSMDEKLLFASASTVVGTKGIEALKSLAQVLVSNPDISVLIEGHTDNIPYKGTGGVKDNWDLSVIRATSIVKILASKGVSPKRMTAAGRGEFYPIDDNSIKEGRARNRRTEIILTPKLDELFQIIETN
ncbi:MAG: OmpA family protein [Bacteroidota bacterium]